MKNHLALAASCTVLLAASFSLAPTRVSADAGPPPSCLYPEGADTGNANPPTCKAISDEVDIVTVDPSLRDEYLLGVHSSFESFKPWNLLNPYSPPGPMTRTQYSEQIVLATSSSLVFESGDSAAGSGNTGTVYDTVLLDKDFFSNVPSLKSFSTCSSIEEAHSVGLEVGLETDYTPPSAFDGCRAIDIVNLKELQQFFVGATTSSQVMAAFKGIAGEYMPVATTTFDTTAYSPHIYAPKEGGIIESHYISVDKGNFLSNQDLGVKIVGTYRSGPVTTVPLTSPLKSVTNYWEYTRENGNLTLVWEKSVYGLDDGSTRTLTRNDKSVSLAMLFSSAPVTSNASSSATVSAIASSTFKGSTTSLAVHRPQGFFAWVWRWITSWF